MTSERWGVRVAECVTVWVFLAHLTHATHACLHTFMAPSHKIPQVGALRKLKCDMVTISLMLEAQLLQELHSRVFAPAAADGSSSSSSRGRSERGCTSRAGVSQQCGGKE